MPIRRDARGRFAGGGGGSRKPAGRASRVNKANQTASRLQKSAKASIAASKTSDGKFNLTPKAKTELKQASKQLGIPRKDAAKRIKQTDARNARNAPPTTFQNDAQKAKAHAEKGKAKPSSRTPAEQSAAKARRAAAGKAYTAATTKAADEKAALAKRGADHASKPKKPTKAQARAAALKAAQAKMLAAANKRK